MKTPVYLLDYRSTQERNTDVLVGGRRRKGSKLILCLHPVPVISNVLIGTLKRKRRKKNEQIGGLREFLEEERSILFLERMI